MRIMVTGASGYVGGRLIRKLIDEGHEVSALVRQPHLFASRLEGAAVVQGDLLVPESLHGVFDNIDAVYYLVHQLGVKGKEFERLEALSADNFCEAAKSVKRVIYLGGLGGAHSPHMRSRRRVGEILRERFETVVELRASIVLGAGSISYELMKGLVEKLPVMIAPRWVVSKCQPIYIDDVLTFLVRALEAPSGVVEVGGPDIVSFKKLMEVYAKVRGLKRPILVVPCLTPWLSSLWLGLITPVYARVGRKLIESIAQDSVVGENGWVTERGIEEAICLCLDQEREQIMLTKWSDALSVKGRFLQGKMGQKKLDTHDIFIRAAPDAVFAILERMGGKRGWLYGTFLWRLRGIIDQLCGGVGFRRGRRHPNKLVPGDTVDFWRVEEVVQNERVLLLAEMKVPGRAWLKFEIEEVPGGSILHQTAIFAPLGLIGLMYWYFYYPFHGILFRGMLKQAKQLSEQKAHTDASTPS